MSWLPDVVLAVTGVVGAWCSLRYGRSQPTEEEQDRMWGIALGVPTYRRPSSESRD